MSVTIYHNPRCSKSRQTLALLEEQGVTPQVELYLETPPDAATLNRVLQQLGMEPRDLMRKKEEPYTHTPTVKIIPKSALPINTAPVSSVISPKLFLLTVRLYRPMYKKA